jgi:hypothetical protein
MTKNLGLSHAAYLWQKKKDYPQMGRRTGHYSQRIEEFN